MLLCVAVLCAVLFQSIAAQSVPEEKDGRPVIAYVPMDDRPVSTDRVIYLARAAGFTLLMPPRDLYRTRLDGQGENASNGKPYGDGTALMQWLRSVEERSDYFVISLDQMFSGGLVNSRHVGTVALEEEQRRIASYLTALSGRGDKRVIFYDTVMRLALTVGYDGCSMRDYTITRSYGSRSRWRINPEDFATTDYAKSLEQLDRIHTAYAVGEDGSLLSDYRRLTQADGRAAELLRQYHNSRIRKLKLTNLLIQHCGSDAVFFFGADDSSTGECIQRNEIAFLRARMEALGLRYSLMSDADSFGALAVARCAAMQYGTASLRVRYFGDGEHGAAGDFDIGTIRQSVELHVEAAGAHIAEQQADAELFVLTRIQSKYDPAQVYRLAVDRLMARLRENLKRGTVTMVLDATDRSAGYAAGDGSLSERLCGEAELSLLLGYSSWNTAGNAAGLCIAQGVSRLLCLKNGASDVQADRAFLQSMTFAYVKDIVYNTWLRARLQGDMAALGYDQTGNFYTICEGNDFLLRAALEKIMRGGVDGKRCVGRVLENLAGGRYYTSLRRTPEMKRCGTVTVSNYRYPWYRFFEITFDISVSPDAE